MYQIKRCGPTGRFDTTNQIFLSYLPIFPIHSVLSTLSHIPSTIAPSPGQPLTFTTRQVNTHTHIIKLTV